MTPDELLARLRDIHGPIEGLRRLHPVTKEIVEHICDACDRPWPCATAVILRDMKEAPCPWCGGRASEFPRR